MDGRQPTKPTRIRSDVADKLSAVVRYRRESSADYLDHLIRKKVERDYAALPKAFRDAFDMLTSTAATK